jgi:hypothetical protein
MPLETLIALQSEGLNVALSASLTEPKAGITDESERLHAEMQQRLGGKGADFSIVYRETGEASLGGPGGDIHDGNPKGGEGFRERLFGDKRDDAVGVPLADGRDVFDAGIYELAIPVVAMGSRVPDSLERLIIEPDEPLDEQGDAGRLGSRRDDARF